MSFAQSDKNLYPFWKNPHTRNTYYLRYFNMRVEVIHAYRGTAAHHPKVTIRIIKEKDIDIDVAQDG